jgi:predicted lipase
MTALRILTTIAVLLVVCGSGRLATVAARQQSTHHFDPAIAMNGWFYSKTAFCDLTSIQSWTCTTCANNSGVVDVTTFFDFDTGAQGYTGYNTDTNTIVVAYRGSADIQNWIMNLDFFQIEYPNSNCSGGCMVHRGFLYVYQAIQSGVMASLKNLTASYGNMEPTILVTGHSLGAAVAILSAADVALAYKSDFDVLVYTYGEPRVGNPAWALWMSTQVLPGAIQFRVTHKADPVPRIPLLQMGFLHVPHEVWYDNDGAGYRFTTCVDNATTEDMTNCENTQFDFAAEDHLLYMGVVANCQL